MERAYGLHIPETLADVCSPERMALLVYDMQVGILSQIAGGAELIGQVARVLKAARRGGYRVFFCRHLSLPKECAGAAQLRQAKAWQRKTRSEEVHPWFLRDAPGFALAPELQPRASEVVFDKITMSAFDSTFLDIALRDCGLQALAVVGVAMEIGIEPTLRHAADRCYLPVLVEDAVGWGDAAAARRSVESLRFAGDTMITRADELCSLLSPPGA